MCDGSIARCLQVFAEGECFAVPVFGFVELAPGLGDHPELVVGGGGAWAVAEFLLDGERFAVPVFGFVESAPALGDYPELMVGRSDIEPVLGLCALTKLGSKNGEIGAF